MFKVSDDVFPLKDIRVRASGEELKHYLEIFKNNEDVIYNDMVRLRKDFGSVKYSINGERILLAIWKPSQTNTATQLRWLLEGTKPNSKVTRKRIFITFPLMETLDKKTKNSDVIIEEIKKLKCLYPSYEKFLEFEKYRVEVNARSKANKRILQCLNEIDSIRFIEKMLLNL